MKITRFAPAMSPPPCEHDLAVTMLTCVATITPAASTSGCESCGNRAVPATELPTAQTAVPSAPPPAAIRQIV